MKNGVFWDVTPYGSCKNGHFEGTYRLHHQDESVLQLLVTVNVVSSTLILFTLMMEAIYSSESSVITGVTQRHMPEDGILHSHSRDSPKSDRCSYIPKRLVLSQLHDITIQNIV
jgi:hypothetical protein